MQSRGNRDAGEYSAKFFLILTHDFPILTNCSLLRKLTDNIFHCHGKDPHRRKAAAAARIFRVEDCPNSDCEKTCNESYRRAAQSGSGAKSFFATFDAPGPSPAYRYTIANTGYGDNGRPTIGTRTLCKFLNLASNSIKGLIWLSIISIV